MLDVRDVFLLSWVTVAHVPVLRVDHVAPHHLEPSLEILDKPMRHPCRDQHRVPCAQLDDDRSRTRLPSKVEARPAMVDHKELMRGRVEVVVGVHRVPPHGLDHPDGVQVRLDLRCRRCRRGERAMVDDERLLLDGRVRDEPRRWNLVSRDAQGRERGQREERFACVHAHREVSADSRAEVWIVLVGVIVVACGGRERGMGMRGYGVWAQGFELGREIEVEGVTQSAKVRLPAIVFCAGIYTAYSRPLGSLTVCRSGPQFCSQHIQTP